MQATFTDEQRALAETARDLAKPGLADARVALEGRQPSTALTDALAGGFAGVGIPEEHGGAGGGLVEVAILLEALGRTVAPTPFVSHVLAIQAAYGAGLDVAPAMASDQRWVIAVEERGATISAPGTTIDGDGRVEGTKIAVRDADGATAAVVTAAEDRVAIAVPSTTSARDPLDPTRPLADCTFDGAAVATGTGAAAGLLRATAALAAEQVGVGRGVLDAAVGYVKDREQFGQPVGRFQAVAHQLADAFVALESAWSLVLYACWAVESGADDARAAMHRAKAKAGDACLFAAERGMQVHGGIGITWEADPHLFLRRALADDAWLGTTRQHRHWLGAHLVASGG